jgi:hypothetical protein
MKTNTGVTILVGLFLLVVVIIWFASTATPATIQPALPVQTTGQANVGEQRIVLNDGQTIVTCLTFPNNGVSCHWPGQR